MKKKAAIILAIFFLGFFGFAGGSSDLEHQKYFSFMNSRVTPRIAESDRSAQVISEEVADKKLLSGFSLKFGWQTSPDPGGFAYAWVGGLAYDLGLSRNVALGLEIIPAYRNYSELDMTMIPFFGFANLKLGLNIFRSVTLFVGAGGGAEAGYTSIKESGKTFSDFKAFFAYHGLAGAEIRFSGFGLIAEFQMVKANDPDVDPDQWRYLVLFGVRF
jgi:hypothetical protein